MVRITFGEFVDKTFWILLVGLGSYATTQLNALSSSIRDLGLAVNTLVIREAATKEKIQEIGMRQQDVLNRLRVVEIKTSSLK